MTKRSKVTTSAKLAPSAFSPRCRLVSASRDWSSMSFDIEAIDGAAVLPAI